MPSAEIAASTASRLPGQHVWPRSRDKALVLIAGAAVIALGWINTDGYVAYLARLAAINVIVAYSLNLLVGYAGQAFIATGATFAIGAYASALSMMNFGAPFVVAWLAGGVLAGAFGLLSALPALRLAGAYLAMVSIAFNVVVDQVLIHWTDVTGGPIGLPGVPQAGVAGVAFDEHVMFTLIVAVAILTAYGCVSLRQSQWGRALAAMGEDELAVKSLGVDTLRLKAVVFAFSSLIVGLAGGLYAHSMQFVSPDIGTIIASFNFVLMLVLGGMKTTSGPLLGAVFLTLLPQFLGDFQRYHLLVLGIILLAVITMAPGGLAQIVRAAAARLSRQQPEAVPATAAMTDPTFAGLDQAIAPRGRHELIVEGIDKSFGGVAALHGAAITAQSGMIRGLIGPNGSGKSTLINVITGFDRADAGEIRFDDRRIDGGRSSSIALAGIVRSFQTPRVFADLSVRENLLVAQFPRHPPGFFAGLLGLPASSRVNDQAMMRARTLARAVGLEHLVDKRAVDLSQGDKRKLEIARALATEPSVLILDEPAAGLSAEEGAVLCQLLERLRARGLAVILVEHHMDVIMRVCDRITVIERGRVIAEGTPQEIRADEEVRRAYLGIPDDGVPPPQSMPDNSPTS